MNLFLSFTAALLALSLFSCEDASKGIFAGFSFLKKPQNATSLEKFNKPPEKTPYQDFVVNFGGLALNAKIDREGNGITITNYPSEWRGKISLVRFDGQNHEEEPFSKSHCEMIRKSALNLHGQFVIRRAYRSLLVFDIPPFLSLEFMSHVLNSSQSAGNRLSYLTIENEVDRFSAYPELVLNENSIARSISESTILDHFNLEKKATDKGSLQRKLIINAADIICDLISGDATFSMVYPISGEDRFIKLIYDPLEIKL